MARTVPNRHLRSGDRPAPNKIEFEELVQGVSVKSRGGRFQSTGGQSAVHIEVEGRVVG